MNRYVTVQHLCGCKQEMRVYGDETNKKRQRDRELKELCSDCWQYAVRTNTLYDEERERAKAMAISRQTRGLVPLEGSEKQISWAESIRQKIKRDIEETSGRLKPQRRREFEEFVQVIMGICYHHVKKDDTHAAFWIGAFKDNKDIFHYDDILEVRRATMRKRVALGKNVLRNAKEKGIISYQMMRKHLKLLETIKEEAQDN